MTERYHTISLVAVFLALSAGMIIGVFFLQSPVLTTTTKTINDLKVRADQLQIDNQSTRAALDTTKSQLRAAASAPASRLESMLAGELRNRAVAIIQLGDSSEAVAGVAHAIQLAGGEIVTTITVDQNTITPDAIETLRRWLGRLSAGIPLAALRELSGVTTDPSTGSTRPAKLVVVVGGHTKEPANKAVEGQLLDELTHQTDLRVVGAEQVDAQVSSIPTFISKGIASTDCVDTALGQLALPFLLQGTGGAYGVKRTADAPLPVGAYSGP